ncbi:MAG: ABC transporter ATP-binding protein [Halanaeroarchaeum sp.]
MTLLDINDLSVRYRMEDSPDVHAVDDVSFEIDYGETVGLVGESGCGKTTIGKSLLSLLDDNGEVVDGEIWYDGLLPEWEAADGSPTREAVEDDAIPVRSDGRMDLSSLSIAQMRRVRWNDIALIPQGSMNALNPVYKVGDQIAEAITLHEPGTTEAEAHQRARDLLERIGIERERADDYAHEFSGGMKQRAVIAMAMACDPDLVIADEPTTALDVITQDRVLDIIGDMQEEFDVSMLIISHDISVMAETCDRLGVMYAGKLMEMGDTTDVFERPANPYTLGLQNSFPTLEETDHRLLSIPGTPPTLQDPDPGCQFVDRCPFAVDRCAEEHPPLESVEGYEATASRTEGRGHYSACHRLDSLESMREDATNEETWNIEEPTIR